MILFILSLILVFIVDTILVGISFCSLSTRFGWNLSPKVSFVVLIIIFALFENYVLPMVYVLDATITVGNEELVRFFDLEPNFHLMDLYNLGFFDFFLWCIQAFFAGLIGEKLLGKEK